MLVSGRPRVDAQAAACGWLSAAPSLRFFYRLFLLLGATFVVAFLLATGQAHADEGAGPQGEVSVSSGIESQHGPETVEQATEPVSDPVAQPVAQPVSDPVAQPVSDPVAQPVSDPVAQPVSDPVAQPVSDPVAQPVSDPVAQPVSDPVAQPVSDPVAQPVSDPVAQPVSDPVAQPVSDPVAQPVSDPVAQPVSDPVAQPVSDPVAQPVSDPVAQPVSDPVAQPVSDPAAQPVIEPVVEVVEPVVVPSTVPGSPIAVGSVPLQLASPAVCGSVAGAESATRWAAVAVAADASAGRGDMIEGRRAVPQGPAQAPTAPSAPSAPSAPNAPTAPGHGPASVSGTGCLAPSLGVLDNPETGATLSADRFAAGDDTVPHSRAALLRTWPG